MILTNYYFLKDLYKHLPRQRRLPEALKTQASTMLAMNSNRKLVQSKLMEESGNVILLKDLSNISAESKADACTVQTTEGIKTVTVSDCDCTFRRSMMLPCRHIFAVRSSLNEPLFYPELCNIPWTSAYYYETQTALFDIAPTSSTSLQVT